ncbi:CopD family protein [Cyanobium sp. Morenito 9A2]|nr:CopD family protein [Cyanobium sp. Morenito 9A2]
MLKLLVIVHALGASIWTGGHLLLALGVLPPALKAGDPMPVLRFERAFERLGLGALALQLATGLALARLDLGRWEALWSFDPGIARSVALKLLLLAATLALALQARWQLIPRLTAASLPRLAVQIVLITLLAVGLLVVGASIRLGGLGL